MYLAKSRLLLVICVAALAGCSGPLLWLPGGALSGEEVPFIEIPAEAGVIQLETNPTDPYSVNVGVRVIDGQMYIDPAAERQWYKHIATDAAVRIRFDGAGSVHPMTAEVVEDELILAEFESDRIVLRLVPRAVR